MVLSDIQVLEDAGYPGMKPEYLGPMGSDHTPARLCRADLKNFWLIDYRSPNGLTPMGISCLNAIYGSASKTAADAVPMPLSEGFHVRVVGTACYTSEASILDQKRIAERIARFEQGMPEFYATFEDQWKTEAQHILARAQAQEQRELTGLSGAELSHALAEALDYVEWSCATHFRILYQVLSLQSGFYAFCDELNIPRSKIAELLRGVPSKITQTDRQILQMSASARKLEIADLYEPNDIAGFLQNLKAKGGDFAQWAQAFDAFLTEYGWRSITSFDPNSPTWIERPDIVLDMIFAITDRQAAEPVHPSEIERSIRKTLTTRETKVFDRALEDVRKANFVWWSEDHNFYLDFRAVIPVRRAVLAVGKHLSLPEAQDAMFLFIPELHEALKGTRAPETLAPLIAERKRYFEKWKTLRTSMPKYLGIPPEVLTDPIFTEIEGFTTEFLAALRDGPGETLKGIPASRGKIKARARRVASASDLHLLQNGEIIVCEGTTPAWTTSFLRAGGCLTDNGGTLSHAAIVSREYGVPCIVSLAVATQSIHTGDLIEMNADDGTVKILPAERDHGT